jgi:hypothetical protein
MPIIRTNHADIFTVSEDGFIENDKHRFYSIGVLRELKKHVEHTIKSYEENSFDFEKANEYLDERDRLRWNKIWEEQNTGAKLQSIPEPTCVYLMKNKRNGYIKIGVSQNPVFREKTLQSEEPEVELIFKTGLLENGEGQELHLHTSYSQKRLRGEWFNLSSQDCESIIKYLSSL